MTPLPYLNEIGVKNGVNSLVLNFDCSNVKDVVANIKNKMEFNFVHLDDHYERILAKGKSKYQEERKKMLRIRITRAFRDVQNGMRMRAVGEVLEEGKTRAEQIVNARIRRNN